ncbi:MAG TPA: hypothetical protein VMT43_02500 [Acidimicrobiales bacterium]|nr:hypothetical protein [Acidimicrobiales bacterium]
MSGEWRRRRRLVLPVMIVLAAALGAGGALVLRREQTRSPEDRLVEAVERQTFASFRPGASWTSVTEAPDPSLAQAQSAPALAHLVDTGRFWTSTETSVAVQAWAKAHPPPGTTAQIWSPGGLGGIDASTTFKPAESPTGVTYLAIIVTSTPLTGAGSGIRVDVQVVVAPRRPDSEHVPDREDAVTVTAAWQAYTSGRLSHTFHDRAVIARLTGMVNAMSISVVTKTSCPAEEGQLTWTIKFSGEGQPIIVQSDVCGFTTFSSGSHRGPVLATDHQMLEQEARLLGTTVEAVDNRVADAATIPRGCPVIPPCPTTTTR